MEVRTGLRKGRKKVITEGGGEEIGEEGGKGEGGGKG
jgi:hypothetical protein